MKKYFQTFVKKYQVIPKSSIYDEYAKHLISEFNKHEATLYFIVKTKKVSFNNTLIISFINFDLFFYTLISYN